MIKLMDMGIYKLPNGRFVEALPFDGKMILNLLDDEEIHEGGSEPIISDFRNGFEITSSGIILDGLNEICSIEELEDTLLCVDIGTGRVIKRLS